MNTQKIILGILGLGVVLGLGFIIVKSNNKIVEQENIEKPTEIPVPSAENETNSFVEFGKAISLKLNDEVAFPDGLTVILKEINDSRCPEGMQCFWMGEISGLFAFSGGALTAPKEIRLGTVNKRSVSWKSYNFSLKDATENSITIEITKN